MALNIDLLKQICEIPGAPGFEKLIRELILKQVKSIVDETRVDNMGNIFCLKKGTSDSKPAMAAAHMDEIGFIVTYIDDNGFLRFHTLGGFDPRHLLPSGL